MEDPNIRIAAEEQLIDNAFQHLLESYLASSHRKKVDIITKAFNFARNAHKGVRRLSGEPYIMHPIAVAQIACEEMGLGSTSICSALLHDVVEDTEYTVEDIKQMFGNKIAEIVEGLTKISGGLFGDNTSMQTENIKKLLLTMSEDIRVVLIKICDRLHNMRTLTSQPAHKQYKIAGETQYIYAPIANRLGLNKIKTELENLSFKFEHPDSYNSICEKLKLTQGKRDELFEQFTKPIREALDKMGYEYEIKARIKSPYSIWCKMQNKHVPFEEIYDIMAVRIIFTPKDKANEDEECVTVFRTISPLYNINQSRTRDWLNHPKENGYRAIHITQMSDQGNWVEVQIRTEKMNEIAERGVAAHWKYKAMNEQQNVSKESSEEKTEEEIREERRKNEELNNWLRTISEILDDPQPDAMDFLDTLKLNLYANEIFVFTPKGQMKTMPSGSTALDFAFMIHTFLGSHCIGAKVNHKLVPLSHKLQGGDQVEIMTSQSQRVQPEWLKFARTAKAKGKIQAILRREGREAQKKGEQVLNEWLKANELKLTTNLLDRLCELHEIQKHETLFLALGKRTIILGDKDLEEIRNKKNNGGGRKGWRRYVPFINLGGGTENKTVQANDNLLLVGKDFNKKIPCRITEETHQMYIFPNCCHPIPGDDILGFIDNKKHVEIHKRACPVANRLKTSYGNRILDAKWDMHKLMFFNATIEIHGIDRKGMLHDVANVISDELDIYIRKVTIGSNDGIFEGTLEISVHDRTEVKTIMAALKKVDGMQDVLQIM